MEGRLGEVTVTRCFMLGYSGRGTWGGIHGDGAWDLGSAVECGSTTELRWLLVLGGDVLFDTHCFLQYLARYSVRVIEGVFIIGGL